MDYGFSPSLTVAACQMERDAIVGVGEVIYSNFHTDTLSQFIKTFKSKFGGAWKTL